MASSSRTPKGRKGKQVMRDDEDDNHDPYRFFTNFHEKFFLSYVASKAIIPSTKFKLLKGQYRDVKRQILMRGWVKLGKPKKNISATLVREFYANARKNPDVEDSREFRTFVRGVSFGFSKERIRDVLELRGPLDSETSFNVRKLRSNRDTDAILRDICIEGAVWETGAHMNPLKLRRQDLTPLARGWHDFVIHNIKPTSNQSEVTVERAVLIHCIITSQEVEPFPPSPQYQSQHQEEGEQPAFEATFEAAYEPQSYGWGQLQEDMANMKQVQMEFYENSCANDMYIHWGLQQCIPNYGPTNLEDIPQIPHKIRDNLIFSKPWHEGLIRPTQPSESSTAPQQQAPPQQAPPEANAPRRENPDSDDE
ncbi:hypothetical protein PIB30_079563 [Stylosanthes scabra]|uniref:Putative plant transposon protein domain-containing protein n=1 Tax=Stylosanthes scabra TaxID=79078 RepID=A0ABU6UPZ7_9FABA|nr:hypothetical protein [Stylosanthes scabra]